MDTKLFIDCPHFSRQRFSAVSWPIYIKFGMTVPPSLRLVLRRDCLVSSKTGSQQPKIFKKNCHWFSPAPSRFRLLWRSGKTFCSRI